MPVYNQVHGYGPDGDVPVAMPGGQQARYREQVGGADIALGNISFAIYPFFPFSYDWAMAERTGGQGTVFRPTVTFDASFMEKIGNFKRLAEQGPLYQGGIRSQGFGRVSDLATGGDIWERSLSNSWVDPQAEAGREAELASVQAARAGESDADWVRRFDGMNFDVERDIGSSRSEIGYVYYWSTNTKRTSFKTKSYGRG